MDQRVKKKTIEMMDPYEASAFAEMPKQECDCEEEMYRGQPY